MIWLKYIVPLLLWTCCNSQNVCEEPPEIDFGETVSDERVEYRNGDRVQYRCFPGYTLEGLEWITCKGPEWTPAPKCLAPCIVTKQQLEAKNLFLSAGQRHSLAVGNHQTLEFLCKKGYVLSAPSIRRCIDGHMDLPSCISERGKNCSRSPTIENGDITTLSQEQYTSGSSVEFKCQRHYAMEGHSSSFCDNGNWTKVPVCLEPCVISLAEIERHNITVKMKSNEDAFQTLYLPHGDFIEFHCKSGHVLATNPSRSVFEFQCRGGPIVYPECKERPCGHPGDIQFGSFELINGEEFVFGSRVVYQCDPGYQMLSQTNYRDCRADGWSNDVPHCEEIICKPGNIANGYITSLKEVYKEGDELQFDCRTGYKPVDRSVAFCSENGWNTRLECIEVVCSRPEVDNGNVSPHRQRYSYEETIEIQCNPGYEPERRQKTSQCNKNGWVPQPKCVSQRCNYPDAKNAIVYGSYGDYIDYYFPKREGDYIDFKCKDGFLPEDKKNWFWHRTYCTKSGWNPEPKCFKQCEHTRGFLHGKFIYGYWSKFIEGNEISFSCEAGYYPDPQEAKTKCTENGWSPTPRCISTEIPTCKSVRVLNGFFADQKNQFALNERAGYSCQIGFTTREGFEEGETQCLREGWTPKPECVHASCGNPPSIANGGPLNGTQGRYLPGTKVKYRCNEGFDIINTFSTCKNKSWTPGPTCKEKSCGSPPQIFDASLDKRVKKSYASGETVSYTCHPGFAADGPLEVTCRKGQWTEPPTCEDGACGDPPTVANADIINGRSTVYKPHHEVQYRCRKGFEMSGSDTVTCGFTMWSDPPTCEDVTCPPPNEIGHGRIAGHPKERYMPFDTVNYQCEPGWRLSGPVVVTCLRKQWTNLPRCIDPERNCGRPLVIQNGDVLDPVQAQYPPGATLRYKCQNLYLMNGSAEVHCENGLWTQPPTCIEACTIGEEDMARNNIQLKWKDAPKLYTASGVPVEFMCRRNYRLARSSPPLRTHCINGRVEYPRCVRRYAEDDD